MSKRKKHFLVAGLGRFGASVALTLQDLGYDVLGVDDDENLVQDISGRLNYVICADASNEKTLQSISLSDIDVAVVAIGDLEGNMMCTMMLKEMGVPRVVTKALNELHGKMLEKIGADKVVYAEKDMGERVAHNLISNSIMDYIELSSDISVMSLHVPEDLIGKNLIEANLRKLYNVNVVGIRRKNRTIVNPEPTQKFCAGDELIIIGAHDGVTRMGVDF